MASAWRNPPCRPLENQLVLQLPGEQDPTAAARILGDTALLEFRAQAEAPRLSFRSSASAAIPGQAILQLRKNQRQPRVRRRMRWIWMI